MRLVLQSGDQETYLAWATPRVGIVDGSFPENTYALAVVDADTGAIIAVVGYTRTYDGLIDMHIASDGGRRWATRNILGGLFGYAFHMLGARKVSSIVDPDSREVVLMCIKLGFQFETRLRASLDDGRDAYLFTMLKDECTWIKEA